MAQKQIIPEQETMNTLTDNRTTNKDQTTTYVTPLVDIAETKDAYLLQAEMPGVPKSGLEVLLERNELTIVGHRTRPTVSGQALLRESRTADYRRVFELDPSIDTQKIDARIDQGLLTLRLPKSEEVKPRRIQVTD